MQYARDIYGRFGLKNGKIKTFGTDDIENMSLMLTVLRGRMLGMSWRDLSEYTGIELSTLFDRSTNYLGDMIVKYDFKKRNLPERYRAVHGKGLCPETGKAVVNDYRGRLIPIDIMKDCLEMNSRRRSVEGWIRKENNSWNDRLSPEAE